MKKLFLAPLLAALVVVPASAEEDFSVTATIAAPAPPHRVLGGITELSSPCLGDPDVGSNAQGVDGYWFTLPDDGSFDGLSATLTADAPNDVDAWFYDAGCGLINTPEGYSMMGDRFPYPPEVLSLLPPDTTPPSARVLPDGNESGVIPEGAAWVIVNLYAGANATFTFTVDNA